MLVPTAKEVARFWRNVRVGDGCHEWLRSRTRDGYGVTSFRGKQWRAHRAAWLLAHGDPGGSWVLHRCDNRRCVNPAHLFLGDNSDNMIDCVRKGRHAHAILTVDDVREIRTRSSLGERPIDLAREFGVVDTAIHNVVSGLSWGHVA